MRVRQAAAYAIDRNFFAKVIMMGLVTPSATPITPFSPFYTKDVNMYDVNLEKAKKLLDEAGYPVKADGTRFTVTVDYAPGSPTTKMMAEYLKPQLAKVGIDANIRISPDFARGPNGCPTTTSTSPPTTCSTGAIPSSACTARIPPPTS
ncbi:MAG: ABC transporter substrate-binding protein [Bilophila wadsworthia]